jgi:DNA-binding NarL/FixJ family response regulator
MRVILVGPADDRDRLRALLPSSVVVTGEAPTLDAALRAAADVDAILIAPSPHQDTLADALPSEPLTSRELDVLRLLADGLPNKAIAARLGISDQTVKFHVAAICGKLGVANRTGAARKAIALGLVPL